MPDILANHAHEILLFGFGLAGVLAAGLIVWLVLPRIPEKEERVIDWHGIPVHSSADFPPGSLAVVGKNTVLLHNLGGGFRAAPKHKWTQIKLSPDDLRRRIYGQPSPAVEALRAIGEEVDREVFRG